MRVRDTPTRLSVSLRGSSGKGRASPRSSSAASSAWASRRPPRLRVDAAGLRFFLLASSLPPVPEASSPGCDVAARLTPATAAGDSARVECFESARASEARVFQLPFSALLASSHASRIRPSASADEMSVIREGR